MNTIRLSEYHSPAGELILGDYNGQLCLCDWKFRKQRSQIDTRIQKVFNAVFETEPTDFLDEVQVQLESYFNGARTEFDLPLILAGTDFQERVWNELLKIPFGETASYLELSEKLGDVNAIRAVAAANGANAISIVVPCHRIIGSDGSLVGYAGGIRAKKKLLEYEGAITDSQMSLEF
ncbi:MAG: methylated-DNA--[protein]-cysteine S-methyltransferase [Flavobacteriia bacterium]|nr:methylated-DNA--[protein]-cysteine S-methyltransferase [Flavobacteriia bacterium]